MMTKPTDTPKLKHHRDDDGVERHEREARDEHAHVQPVVRFNLGLWPRSYFGCALPRGSSCPPAVGGRTCAFSAAIWASMSAEPTALSSWAWMSSFVLVRSVNAPEAEQLIERAAARLHLGNLVLGALHRGARVAHGRGDATHGFVDVRGGFGSGVGRLDRLFARAEGFDLALQFCRGCFQLLQLIVNLGVLDLEVLQLSCDRFTSSEGLAREVLVALAERRLGLFGQLVALALQLLGLDLYALPRGGDVGDGPLHLGQVLELLLVRKVERLTRVFRLVQSVVRLRLKDRLLRASICPQGPPFATSPE